jgi:predicted lipid-binding transport protein (Tim44 family)
VKRAVLTLIVSALTLSLLSAGVDAKRLGGGGSSGMKRSVPTQSQSVKPAPAQPNQQNQQAAAPAAPAAPVAPAAVPPKRSWLGPIAGIAAGLGIAALASHFGLGGALANVMTMVLLAVVAMAVIGFLMRRFGNKGRAQQPAMQFAGGGAAPFQQPTPLYPQAATTAPTARTDDGFDAAGFEQIAKRVFIRMQAANDAGDQADLRRFTTPEMYGVVQQELLDRRGAAQNTEVLQLDARVIDRAEEHGDQIVSVRFWGQIRERSHLAPEDFDEIWHLVRPLDGSREWAIAGIQATA